MVIPEIAYEIKNRFPHDPEAFTEGLVYFDGALYESTGLYGYSDVRRLNPENGRIERSTSLPKTLFGEGLTAWGDTLIQLTWKAGTALVYSADLHRVGSFTYGGEGWGAARLNDGRIAISDGSSRLRIIDRDGSEVTALRVTAGGREVRGLNELEMAGRMLYANVYPTDCIARIDPATGVVNGWLDVSGLMPWSDRPDASAIANGIGHDPTTGDLFVTGKRWPYLFRIRVLEQKDLLEEK